MHTGKLTSCLLAFTFLKGSRGDVGASTLYSHQTCSTPKCCCPLLVSSLAVHMHSVMVVLCTVPTILRSQNNDEVVFHLLGDVQSSKRRGSCELRAWMRKDRLQARLLKQWCTWGINGRTFWICSLFKCLNRTGQKQTQLDDAKCSFGHLCT